MMVTILSPIINEKDLSVSFRNNIIESNSKLTLE